MNKYYLVNCFETITGNKADSVIVDSNLCSSIGKVKTWVYKMFQEYGIPLNRSDIKFEKADEDGIRKFDATETISFEVQKYILDEGLDSSETEK